MIEDNSPDNGLIKWAALQETRPDKRRLAAGRVWRLCSDHYTIRRRLSGDGLITELLRRRQDGASLRQAFADMARELRRLKREVTS